MACASSSAYDVHRSLRSIPFTVIEVLSYGKDCCFDTKRNYLAWLVSVRKIVRVRSFVGIQTFL